MRSSEREILDTLVSVLLDDMLSRGTPKELCDRFRQCIDINVTCANFTHGREVLRMARQIAQQPLDTKETYDLSILGWLTEFLVATYRINDDITDATGGKPSWYHNVGGPAINDSAMIKTSIFIILRRQFIKHPEYVDLVDIYKEGTFRAELHRLCTSIPAPQEEEESRLSTTQYPWICQQGTVYWRFYLPLVLALLYLGKASKEKLDEAETVTLAIARYLQIRADYEALSHDSNDPAADVSNDGRRQELIQSLQLSQAGRVTGNQGVDVNTDRRNENVQDLYLHYRQITLEDLERIINEIEDADDLQEGLSALLFGGDGC